MRSEREALRALLALVRRDAPHLSGKVVGDAEAALAFAPAADPIGGLVAAHQKLLDDGNHYAYFELAYTRQTEWMAWLCSKPREDDPNRRVLACGQGGTPAEACAAALQDQQERLATVPPSGGTHG